MTVDQIIEDLNQDKNVSRARLYVYLKRFEIKPVGIRQVPQRYPEDAAAIIRSKLGLPERKRIR